MKERGIISIENYYRLTESLGKQFASEVTIHFSVGENLPKVQMTFDRIDENENGGLDVLDWKTGAVMVGKKLSSDLQAPLYIKGIQEHYGRRVDTFRFIYLSENKERIFERIDEQNYVCKVGKREYFININDAIKEVQRVFSKIQKGYFSIPDGSSMHYTCKFCHIKDRGICEGADIQAWKNANQNEFRWR